MSLDYVWKASKVGRVSVKTHVKVDTGIRRTAFVPEEARP